MSNGTSANHGMQVMDLRHLSNTEIIETIESSEMRAYCPHCGTDYRMVGEHATAEDAEIMINHFRKNHCIECVKEDWLSMYSAGLQNVLLQLSFTFGGRKLEVLRIPNCFRSTKVKQWAAAEKREIKNPSPIETVEIDGRNVPVERYDAKGKRITA
jgi:hypothetical protein